MSDQDPHERIGAAIRTTAASVQAPASLRAHVEAERAAHRPPAGVWVLSAPRHRHRSRRVRLLVTAGATAGAACTAALALLSGGGPPAAPTVAEAATIALGPATDPPPPRQRDNPSFLAADVDGLPFPAWRAAGWRVSGQRRVRLDGREVLAVFYTAPAGERVGYAIVSGPGLAVPAQGRAVTNGSVRFTVLRRGAVRLITWRQAGHTCVIAGTHTSSQQLLALAAASAPSRY